jgi:hypothetical protein
MQPADQLDKDFYVSSSAGAAVTGLVTGNFTVTAWHTPYGGSTATWSHGLVVSELGSGWYHARLTLPATAGQWTLSIAHATHIVTPFGWADELENYDLDGMAALVARPIVRVQGSGTLGEVAALPTLINKRKAIITLAIVDENGDPAPINVGYLNWKVGFRSQTDQTATPPKLDAVHGTPTGFSLVVIAGLVTITIPDDCSIFGALTEGATPTELVTIDMEVTAENPSGQTVSIVAPSPLVIRKRVEGS